MQINNTSVPYPDTTSKTDTKQNVVEDNSKEIEIPIGDFSMEPNTLTNMSFEEIQTYLLENNIDDEFDSRANDLVKLQKFSDKVDTATYTKMTNALLEEETPSLASMRYATFPSEEILDRNPEFFNALLDTSLGIEDTVRSLIFSLDLKKDFGSLEQQNNIDDDSDFSNQSFIEFLLKKVLEIEDNSKNGNELSEKNRIVDYTSLINNFNKYLQKEEENISVDILI